jgi:GR25 family glycosyltransferase involved in LPS biosynthesis
MYPTYVINLDRVPEKWEKLKASATWPLTRFSAIDGSTLTDRPGYMNAMMWGCLSSHRALWKIISNQNQPCLVLEDDCVLYPELQGNIESAMRSIPSDYDAAILGSSGSDVEGDTLLCAAIYPMMRRRSMRRMNKEWHIPGAFIGLHCYLLTPAGAAKLCANKETYHADCVVCRDASVVMYMPNCSLVSQQAKIGQQFMYNRHVSWGWLACEPVFDTPMGTVRTAHLVGAYGAIAAALFASSSKVLQACAVQMAAIPAMHYWGTTSQIKATRGREYEEIPNTKKALYRANDAMFFVCLAVVGVTASQQGKLKSVVNLIVVLQLLKMFISSRFTLPDPSCFCDQMSLKANSFMNYCGDLFISGHILPSLVLTKIAAPALSTPLVAAQTYLILKTKSHYVQDILRSVLLTDVVGLFMGIS